MEKVDSFWAECCQKYILFQKKTSYKTFSASNFIQKSPRCLSPWSGARGSKDYMVEILNCTEMEKYIHFWAEHCWKDAVFEKKLKIKVFWHRISYKKVHEGICLSPHGVELGGSKDDMVEINTYFWHWKQMRICNIFLLICRTSTGITRWRIWDATDILHNWRKWNQNQTKMSNNFHEFPYALILFDKDIREYSRASALCSEQLEQPFRAYMGYMGSWITWSIYNFGVGMTSIRF